MSWDPEELARRETRLDRLLEAQFPIDPIRVEATDPNPILLPGAPQRRLVAIRIAIDSERRPSDVARS
jgi:hypothetical protein